ncbi:MAG: hypothetical protein AAF492_18020, partial [Verrucomicrobiota bacterium]
HVNHLQFTNWWNIYEAGLKALNNDQPDVARELFETALGLRRGARFGYPFERWRAKTYGFHIIEDYFPHRELGVALFRLGEFDQARKMLTASLDQVPSGRAKFYLNETHRALLKDQVVDAPIFDGELVERIRTHQRELRWNSAVSSEAFIDRVRVNAVDEFFERARKRRAIEETFVLKEGENTIVIEGRDLLGRTATKKLVISADWQPPQLAVRRIDPLPDGWRAACIAVDDMDLGAVEFVGCRLHGGLKTDSNLQKTFEVDVVAGSPALIRMRDKVGNLSSIEMNRLLGESDGSTTGRPEARLLVARSAVPMRERGRATARDFVGPKIDVNGSRIATVHRPEAYLSAVIQDDGGLAGIRVNDRNLMTPQFKGALRFPLLLRTPLQDGANAFSIQAIDGSDNESRIKMQLTYKQPPHHEPGYRLSLGVSPVLNAKENGPRLQNLLKQSVTAEPIRFQLKEGALPEDLTKHLKQQVFSGKLLKTLKQTYGSDLLLVGRVFHHGRKEQTIRVRVVDLDTGDTISREDVYTEAAETEALMQGLISKVERRFPMSEGWVNAVKN